MTDYIHDPALVADPVTFARAADAAINVYDANDTFNASPLTLRDLNGAPLANPITSSVDGYIPGLITTSGQLKLVGGGLTVIVSSYQAMRTDALAAQAEAQEAKAAANSAQAAAANSASDAADALAAAQLAALAAVGGGVAIDPTDEDTLVFTTKSDGSIAVDPADPDALLIIA